MLQSKAGRVLFFTILILAGLAAFFYWRYFQDLKALASSIPAGSAVNTVSFEPSFTLSFDSLERLGITVVSTGKISDFNPSGDLESKVLETVSTSDDGKLRKLDFIIQLTSRANPRRNVSPWVIKQAAGLEGQEMPDGAQPYTNEKLEALFPRGSKWIFVPLLNPNDADISGEIPEYNFYAQDSYGKDSGKVRNYVGNGLVGNWNKPIFLLDIFYLFPK